MERIAEQESLNKKFTSYVQHSSVAMLVLSLRTASARDQHCDRGSSVLSGGV